MAQDKTKELLERGRAMYLPVYAQREMILDHGKGARLWDIAGNEYIDLGAGIAVSVLGHQNAELIQVAIEQMQKLWHTSNVYFTEPAIRLASDLVKNTFAERVFFSNSGAEANEAAIKLARKFASFHSSSEKHEIITFEGSFHGRTLTTVTATAQPKYQEGFGPLPGGFTYCPFNDFDAIEQQISDKTCAVLVEPIQGEGGVHVAKPGFLAHLQALCQKHDALLVFDEIQSGMGRTGRLFAYEWEDNIQPDIVTVAKALGGGLPIGSMLTTERVSQVMKVGDHGSTFGGNPVITAVAGAVLQQVCSSVLMDNVKKQSDQLQMGLKELQQQKKLFKEIRGKGLIVGAELQEPWEGKAAQLSELCRQHGVLILQAGPNVLRFLPPLNITDEELQEGLQRMKSALSRV